MKYIVYQTTCKINNKIYIGVHLTLNPNIFDGYIGCGIDVFRPSTYQNPRTAFQYAVKKYGYKNFIRTILQIFENENDAYELEKILVNEDFIKRDDVYNLVLGGKFHTSETQKKCVYMYDLDGKFEQEFSCVNDAARFLGRKTAGHLARAIRHEHQFLGHQFSYKKLPFMKKLNCLNRTSVDKPYIGNKVGRFDDSGNLLEEFNTMTDCIKAGYKNAKLVALGKRNHCKGYVFKYLN